MTLTPRDRVLLCGIAIVLAAFGFYHFALSPARRQAASLESQLTTARSQLVQAQSRYAAGRSAAGSLRTSAPSFTAAERAVPAQADVPALLRILQRSAHDAHVDLQSVSLSGASTSSTSVPSVTATGAGGATQVPVSLTFQGGYQALKRLVRSLDDLVVVSGNHVRATGPLVGISNVSLSAQSGAALTVSITAVIYQRSSTATDSGTIATEGAS